jgi:flagellar M-ring protein FliF
MAIAPRQLLLDRFEGFNRLTNGQKFGLMLGLAALFSLLVGSWIWFRTPDYKVLYSNLNDRDGGTIVATLQQQNIPYKMAEGGGAILVPADMVYETRLKLASQGLPRGGSVGFELLENQKLGVSQFQEQVNFQRALEGELARTIQSLASVQSARVHLAIPRPTVFIREQEKPSASVLLTLYPGRVLDPAQVTGIMHLVSSSVPQLSYKDVTVVDQNGNMLNRTDSEYGRMGLEPAQLEYTRQVEQSYIKRIESILTPIAGPNNVHAQVAADVDFSQTEQTAETFKPNPTPAEASVRSEQSSETTGGGAGAVGVPGALSNQPPGAATAPITAPNVPPTGSAGGSQGSSHKETTINYELDKTIRHVKQGAGEIKRLSVAVVVNNRKQTGKDGKVASKPYTADEMRQINNLVKEAMGYSQTRGDTVNIVNADFNLGDKPAEVPLWKDPDTIDLAKEVVKNLLILGIVLLFVFGVVKPLLSTYSMAATRKEEEAEMAASEAARAHAMERIVTAEAGYEDTLNMVKDLAKQEPAIVANVVKEWVNE